MKEPTLIIMAAGMGSRYGGLKQIDPVSDQGEIILDFSLYDAMMAGFKRVIFVIKEEMEDAFRELIDERAGKHMEVHYAFQKLDDIPKGFEIPKEREKPWGTAHAVYSCRELIDGPFAVINADDYYGSGSFQMIYEFLSENKDDNAFCMVGFRLENTITENGHVARGVCKTTEDKKLTEVIERVKIMRHEGKIACTEDDGETWIELDPKAIVSMNFWGYTKQMLVEIEKNLPLFLKDSIKNNPIKGEYYLPVLTDQLIKENKATVQVLESKDKWYGVTYKEDKTGVVNALQSMKDKGLYPEKLWK